MITRRAFVRTLVLGAAGVVLASRAPTRTDHRKPKRTPTLTALPVPTPTQGATMTLARLAYYNRPTSDSSQDAALKARLSSPNGILQCNWGNTTWWSSMVTGTTFTSLMYVLCNDSQDPSARPTGGGRQDQNNWTWRSGLYATLTEDMFLHSSPTLLDSTHRIPRGSDADAGLWGGLPGGYHMDPGSSGWRTFVAARVAEALSGDGAGHGPYGPTGRMDGFCLDNVDGSLALLKRESGATNVYSGTGVLYTDSSYRAAVLASVQSIKAAAGTKLVHGNIIESDWTTNNLWDPYVSVLDGIMVEDFATSYYPSTYTATKLLNMLQQCETFLAAGKAVWCVGQGGNGGGPSGNQADQDRRELLSLACFFLVQDPARTFYRFNTISTTWLGPSVYANQDTDLGTPTAPRYQPDAAGQPTLWQRDYAQGYVQANLTAGTGAIVTNSGHRMSGAGWGSDTTRGSGAWASDSTRGSA